jgi:hypothetical protein
VPGARRTDPPELRITFKWDGQSDLRSGDVVVVVAREECAAWVKARMNVNASPLFDVAFGFTENEGRDSGFVLEMLLKLGR